MKLLRRSGLQWSSKSTGPATPPPPLHLWKQAIGDNGAELRAQAKREALRKEFFRMFSQPISEQIGRYGKTLPLGGTGLMLLCWLPGMLIAVGSAYCYKTRGALPWGGFFDKKGEADEKALGGGTTHGSGGFEGVSAFGSADAAPEAVGPRTSCDLPSIAHGENCLCLPGDVAAADGERFSTGVNVAEGETASYFQDDQPCGEIRVAA
ncbi:unnamed protein product [Amoebophrya sp. A120]|nr:unnamed protein product [Amoebophrya sp. A120]|eukprot:GSA120T00021318001.1